MIRQIDETTPVARKKHTCDYCRTIIQPGTKYYRRTYVRDDIYDWISCVDCNPLTNIVWLWSTSTLNEGIGAETYEEWATDQRPGDQHYEPAQEYLARLGSAIAAQEAGA